MGICNQTITTSPPESVSSEGDLIPLSEMKLVDIKPITNLVQIDYTPQQIRQIYRDAFATNNRLFHHQHHNHRV